MELKGFVEILTIGCRRDQRWVAIKERRSPDRRQEKRRIRDDCSLFCSNRYTEIARPDNACASQGGLGVRTHGKGLYEIADEVQSKIDNCGVRNGTVTVLVQHTSCSIVIWKMPTRPRDAI
jgi:hypothetical protein